MPSLYFIFNELLIELKGIDYMADISPNKDMSLCQLLLFKNTMAFNVFGTPLLRGYYTTHDPVNAKMTFVPVPGSLKTRLQLGMLPINFLQAPISNEFSIWIYLLTAVLVVVMAAIYYFVLIPVLGQYITNSTLVVGISTVIVGGVVAGWVWGVLPLLKDAFGE